MVLIVGRNATRMLEMSTINRTEESHGSVGGDKKAGTVYIGPTWTRSTISLSRAPKYTPSLNFMLTNTTRNPVQRKRSTMVLVRGII